MRLLKWLKSQLGRDPSTPNELGDGSSAKPSSSRASLSLGFSGTLTSLAAPNFRMLWFGTLFSMAAMQINLVSRSWLAYDISGSALALGLVAMARGLPQMVVSPIAGVAADRFDKRKLLILSQCAMCALSLVNAVLVHLGIIEVWHLVVIGLFQGTVFPLTMTTRQAYIPELVNEDKVSNALAVESSGRNLNRVLVPSVAGVLIAWHHTIAFYAIALLYLAGALTLIRLPTARSPAATHQSAFKEMMAGFEYIAGHRQLRILIALGFIAVILGMPFQQLLPVFQVDVLRVGPAQLGFMYTAVGIGALFGSLAVASRSQHPRRGLLQVVAGIGFGVMLIPFATSTAYWLSLILLALIGFASQCCLTLNRIMVLLNTDSKLYGRVMGIYMVTWSLMPVVLLPLGAIVDTIGAPFTVAAAGAVLAACTASMAILVPSIWRIADHGSLPSRPGA